jgi:hypothetical protein
VISASLIRLPAGSWPERIWLTLADRARRSVWTASEHPSPTALHVIVAHDLDAVEQKIIEAELAS